MELSKGFWKSWITFFKNHFVSDTSQFGTERIELGLDYRFDIFMKFTNYLICAKIKNYDWKFDNFVEFYF